MAGEQETIIEFEYDGGIGLLDFDSGRVDFVNLSDATVHNILIEATDADGNVSTAFFRLTEMSLYNITTYDGHTGQISSLAFSPGGQTFASVSKDKMVKLWNIKTKANIATFKHTNEGYSVRFSPDGKTLASGGDDGIKLWDLTTRHDIAIANLPHGSIVNSVSFSPNGKTLASGGDDRKVKLWDLTTEDNIATMAHEGNDGYVLSVSFSPDGKILASSSWHGEIKLWDVETKRHIDPLMASGIVFSVSFSPDGTILASGDSSGEVKL